MEYCPHCMRPASGSTCRHCGKPVQWENGLSLLPAGTVLTGGSLEHSYQIGAVLGQGGFGVTYIALDLATLQRVAIKEYFPTSCAQRGHNGTVEPKMGQDAVYEGGRYHFLQEAQMLASLEGMPAVVQGLDYLELNNTAYLVMEYLDGTPLYRIVNEKGRIPAGDLMPRLQPLLRDIGKLHARSIIHRDISPDNIMWMPDGSLKLLDFGCARSIEDGRSLTLMVKKGFAPVEQYQTRGQGPYTDVYALAATVYYCLTGVIPPASTERQLSGTPLQSPIALGAALTPEEEKALLWGLEVNPKTRPANMDVFSQRLFPFPQTDVKPGPKPGPDPGPGPEPIPGPTPQPVPTPNPDRKRKFLLIGICAAVVVLALVVIILSAALLGSRQQSSAPALPEPGYENTADDHTPQTVSTQQAERVDTPEPAAEPEPEPEPEDEEPAVRTFTTDDGFVYVVEDGSARITGFTGSLGTGGILSIPDTIGEVAVSAIGEGAFRGQDQIQSVNFPSSLRTIEAAAFQDCVNLRDVYLTSDVAAAQDCFDGCEKLRCAVTDGGAKGLPLSADCMLYSFGEDTGAGALRFVWVLDDGAIYGVTDQDVAVLLDIPAGLTELEVAEDVDGYPVTWMNAASLKESDALETIYIPDDLLVDPAIVMLVTDLDCNVDEDTLAFNWLYTCLTAEAINQTREAGQPQIVPCRELVEAAMIRVQELTEAYQYKRPDGSTCVSLLDDTGLDWTYGTQYIGVQEDGEDATDALIRMLLEDCVDEYTEPDPDHDNAFYGRIGIAITESDLVYVDGLAILN